MKKLLLITGIIMLINRVHNTAMAQSMKKENDYKWGISLQVYQPTKIPSTGILINDDRLLDQGQRTSFFYGIGIKGYYFIKENTSIQLRSGFTKREIIETSNIYMGSKNEITNVKYKQTWLNFSPGIRWGLKENNIEVFGGIEIPIIIYKEGVQNNIYTERDTGSYYYNATDDITIPGGFSTGLGGFTGLNFHLSKHVSIGTEFFFGFFYSSLGGDVKDVSNYNGATSGSYSAVTITQVKLKEYSFSQPSVGFNISYSF